MQKGELQTVNRKLNKLLLFSNNMALDVYSNPDEISTVKKFRTHYSTEETALIKVMLQDRENFIKKNLKDEQYKLSQKRYENHDINISDKSVLYWEQQLMKLKTLQTKLMRTVHGDTLIKEKWRK